MNISNKGIRKYLFRFTRHAFSCNNLNKHLGILPHLYKADADPQLTIYGILNTFLYSQSNKNKQKFTFKHNDPKQVYVSILIRTWMTATLLYLPPS